MAGDKIVPGVKIMGKLLIIWIENGLQIIESGLSYLICLRKNGGSRDGRLVYEQGQEIVLFFKNVKEDSGAHPDPY